MATYEKIANLKGPKGDGYANARVIGDNLVMDEMDGTVSNGTVRVGNVRGPKGDTGERGPQGFKGDTGATPNITVEAEGLAAGVEPTVWRDGSDEEPTLHFGIPKGDTGERGPVGPRGPLPKITATAETIPAGEVAEVVASPTAEGAALAFKVPKGDTGAVPQLTFLQPLNLQPGSQPRVIITSSGNDRYDIQLGLVQGNPGTASESVRDDQVSTETVWSSQHTRDEIKGLIDDETTGVDSTFSSQRIDGLLAGKLDSSAVDDEQASTEGLYSSSRVEERAQEIARQVVDAAPDPEWDAVQHKPNSFPPGPHLHSWAEITNKPSTFTPSRHTHSASDITSGTLSFVRLPRATMSTRGAVTEVSSIQYARSSSYSSAVPTLGVVNNLIAQTQTIASDAPSNRVVGTKWFNTDSGHLFIWDGTAWRDLSQAETLYDSGLLSAIDASPSGRYVVFSQTVTNSWEIPRPVQATFTATLQYAVKGNIAGRFEYSWAGLSGSRRWHTLDQIQANMPQEFVYTTNLLLPLGQSTFNVVASSDPLSAASVHISHAVFNICHNVQV